MRSNLLSPLPKSVVPFSVTFTNALGSPVPEVVQLICTETKWEPVMLRMGYWKCCFDDSITDLGGRNQLVYLKWLVYIWDTAAIELHKSLGTSGATLYSTFIVIVS